MTTRWHVKNVGSSPVTIAEWGRQPCELKARHNMSGPFTKKQVGLMKANPNLKLERLRGDETDEGEGLVVVPAHPPTPPGPHAPMPTAKPAKTTVNH